MRYLPAKFRKCCSEDGSKLAYPGFSAVFIQTFCIHDALEFVVPQDAVLDCEKYKEAITEIHKESEDNAVALPENDGKKKDEIYEGWKYKSLAEHDGQPIVYMYQDIERKIFIDPYISGSTWKEEYQNEVKKLLRGSKKNTRFYIDPDKAAAKGRRAGSKYVTKKTLASENCNPKEKVYYFPDTSVHRFSLKGFDFSVPISVKDDDGKEKIEPVLLTGHANVEMSLFYGNTVSIAYKFFFDGYSASIRKYSKNEKGEIISEEKADALTDHIIAFLSCHLGAEFWSENSKAESIASGNDEKDKNDKKEADINLSQTFNVDEFWIDENGNVSEEPIYFEYKSDKNNSEKRIFNNVMLRYKKFLYNNCTIYKNTLTIKEKIEHEKYRERYPLSVSFDHHYAMVDIWGNVKHVCHSVAGDIFSPDRFNVPEREIVDHIRDYHKPELIGLMTLYPFEWKYRDATAYDYVCGENIAIDTDDLVLVGTHVAVVLGTYDRRGKESGGNDWKSMGKVKAQFHVAWPEYLLILQFILAKKVVVSRMKDNMIDLISRASDKGTDDMLFRNSNFGVDLTRRILMLDVVKYAKFASHRAMYDRTMDRMNISRDIDEIHDMSEMLSSNLQNISNHKSESNGFWLNIILGVVSIFSLTELLFQETKFHFIPACISDKVTSLPFVVIWFAALLICLGIFVLGHYMVRRFLNRR